MKKQTPVLLIILDGWGVGEPSETNAIYCADTPNMDGWQAEYPATQLAAHNGAVGLPEGQMGNSEVGHLNIGAGRVVYQDFTRINKAVEGGELAENETLTDLIDEVLARQSSLHFFGLLSDGGVHSHIDHLIAMVQVAADRGLKKIFIHCFLDGRDTPPESGAGYIHALEEALNRVGVGRIASLSGRYYAMDRDKRWDRVEKAWQCLVHGKGRVSSDAATAIKKAYAEGTTDEFVLPTSLCDAHGNAVATVQDGDGVLFFNFRADRARQLTHVFTDPEFTAFDRGPRPALCQFVTCTRYEKEMVLPILFPPTELHHILGEEISSNGLHQLRIAETEKYAHVTYFFNGGREEVFPGEDRLLVDSPREVATYDLKPEMSAYRVTDALLEKIHDNQYDLIVLNFANGDMVGHTGVLQAAIKACEAVDVCLGKLVPVWQGRGGAVLITADHGNADVTYDTTTHGPHTAHTLNPVPLVLVGDAHKGKSLRAGGALCDIAPTILSILGLDQPAEMSGKSLLA